MRAPDAMLRRIYWPTAIALVIGVPCVVLALWFSILFVVGPDGELLFAIAFFGAFGAWLVWVAASGVEILDRKYVGGGPWYPRIRLAADERVVAECMAQRGRFFTRPGHLFVTNKRVLFSQGGPSILFRPTFRVAFNRISRIDGGWVRLGGYAWRTPAISLETADGSRETFTMTATGQLRVVEALCGSDGAFDPPRATSYAEQV